MLIIGETFAAGAGEGCWAGWLVVTRPCDDDDDNDGGVVTDDADSACDVSTVSVMWEVDAVEDDGDDVDNDFTTWSGLLFFGGGASSVS